MLGFKLNPDLMSISNFGHSFYFNQLQMRDIFTPQQNYLEVKSKIQSDKIVTIMMSIDQKWNGPESQRMRQKYFAGNINKNIMMSHEWQENKKIVLHLISRYIFYVYLLCLVVCNFSACRN